MTPQEFAKRIKTKYPEYSGIDDLELTNKIISKHPEYKDQVTFDAAPLSPVAEPAAVTSTGRPAPPLSFGEFAKGAVSRAGDVLKGGVDFMKEVASNTPGGPLATIYPPAMMIGTGRTLAKSIPAAASSFVDNLETRSQAAMDQLDLLKNQPGGPPSLSEFLTSPEASEAMRQSAHGFVPEIETQEAIPGSGGQEYPTAHALGEKATETFLANPPVQTAAAALGAVKSIPLAEMAAGKLRSVAGLDDAAAHLKTLETPHPLGKLEPHELGSIVGQQESQAFALRKAHGNSLYKALDDFDTGVSIKDLIDEDGSFRIPKGVDLPPEVKKAVTAVQRERKALSAAESKLQPGEVLSNEKLDAAMAELDNLPFTAAHDLRKAISEKIRSIDPRGPSAADLPDLMAARKAVQAEMEVAAQQLSPEQYASWKGAEDFWKKEVSENHYRGAGKAINKKVKAADPQKMGKTLEAFAPQDVEAAHRTLVPQGEWAAPAATKAGQKAFDHLVEQRIRTELGAPNAGDKIDLTKAGKAIDMRVGRASWEKMKSLASPEQATRMNNLEKVARAYEKIGAADPGSDALLKLAARGTVGKAIHAFKEIKPIVLEWALEHPARTEILTRGMEAASAAEAPALASRNINSLLRLYALDSGGPPAKPLESR